MIDKSLRKATAERCGSVVVIRMTGGPDCLWLNMYLDTDARQMTCDSDIGFYAYHWGRLAAAYTNFLNFCCNWLADENWLLRKCIGERHIDKGFDLKKTEQNLLKAYKEENADEDDLDCDTYWIEEALLRASGFDDADSWAAVLQASADNLGVDLPEEWYECIECDYTPWQKRFAEICREVIVPELEKLMNQEV